ncbi:MAG: periplasmic heavy metal sensor [Acidobacteriota bacterium]|nr:periplasmic heavy metal sensor [Acidobacteriota bacterium]
MKKRVLLTTGAITLVALIAVPLAFAQRMHSMHEMQAGGDMPGAMMLGHLAHAKAELGLSDQQSADIKAVFQNLHEQNKTYRQSMHSTMAQVAQLLINNPNDVASAQALLDQQLESERVMRTNALNAAAKALNMLTPDQRTKLSTMVKEHLDRRSK